MAFLLPLLGRFLPYILGALAVFALIAGAKHELNKWADNRAAPKILAEQAKTGAAIAELNRYREEQRAYAAKVASDYSSAVARARNAEKERDASRTAFTSLEARARGLANRLAAVPSATVDLLRDSIGAASSGGPEATGTSPVANQPPADTVTEGDRIDWEVAMTRWANECRLVAQGWLSFYRALQGRTDAAPPG